MEEAYSGKINDDLIGNIINEVQHQGGTSGAMYAVAMHFIELARLHQKHAFHLLVLAGWTYADSGAQRAVSCPSFLEKEFVSYAHTGASLLLPYLATTEDFDDYKSAVIALSGFLGHHHFGRFLMGLSFFEGKYHRDRLDEPIFEED